MGEGMVMLAKSVLGGLRHGYFLPTSALDSVFAHHSCANPVAARANATTDAMWRNIWRTPALDPEGAVAPIARWQYQMMATTLAEQRGAKNRRPESMLPKGGIEPLAQGFSVAGRFLAAIRIVAALAGAAVTASMTAVR
jgi:hypothetical protein